MRPTLLIISVFAILAVTLAAKSKKNAREVENPPSEVTEDPAAKETGSESAEKPVNGNETPKRKKNTTKPKPSENANTKDEAASASSKKKKGAGAKKPAKQAEDDEDGEIPEDIEDILMDDEEENVEIEIPTLDQLTTESDPIELGQQIKNLTDENKKKELRAKLKKAWKENKGQLPGRFYQAAYASLLPAEDAEEKAQSFWNNELQKATNSVMKPAKDVLGKANAGVGNVLEDGRKLVQIDPVGTALRRGESVLLSVLSDSIKNLGKLTDFGYDTADNASKFLRMATLPVDYIPIAGEIKNNVHNLFEEQVRRGKYLSGSFAENGSEAFGSAAKHAGKKADEGDELLRRFVSTRKLQ